MLKLEALQPNASVRGVLPDALVTVVNAKWFGSSAIELGKLRFIEVKGRMTVASTITVTKNEILYSLNKPNDFILAIVEFLPDETHRVH